MDNQQFYYKPPNPAQAAKYIVPLLIVIIILAFAGTSVYTVKTDSQAVVQRFGKFVRIESPGLHFKWPAVIEKVTIVPVTRNYKQEFGFRTLKAGVKTKYSSKSYIDESIMLCGDLSVADIKWSIQYVIGDPQAFVFNVRDPEMVLRGVSESVMRSEIGDSSVDEVLSERRDTINIAARDKMQQMLDEYEIGIRITNVTLQEVTPPKEVNPAFNEVNIAQQDKERLKREAEKEYNQVVSRASGMASQMLQQAQAYSIDRTNTAKGDAGRFSLIYEEYQKSKEVTRKRLYLESLSRTLPGVKQKYIVDDQVKGLLPLMNVGEGK